MSPHHVVVPENVLFTDSFGNEYRARVERDLTGQPMVHYENKDRTMYGKVSIPTFLGAFKEKKELGVKRAAA